MADTNLLNRQRTEGRLQLILPQGNEPVDVADFDYNFEIIDEFYSAIADAQSVDVYWDDILEKPNVATVEMIPSTSDIAEIVEEVIGSDIQETIQEIEDELADHEDRIVELENKDIGLFVEDGIILCRYEAQE